MKTRAIRRVLSLCACLAVVPAFAITLGFVPNTQTLSLGQSGSVNLVVSGLTSTGEIVSSYDLDVSYIPTFVAASGVTFGTSLGGPADSVSGFNLNPGVIDLFEISFLTDAELDVLQGDSVTLATVFFESIALGTTPLQFVQDFQLGGSLVVQLTGRNAAILELTSPPGSITVIEPAAPVPEPSSLLLGSFGLLLVLPFTRALSNKRRRS